MTRLLWTKAAIFAVVNSMWLEMQRDRALSEQDDTGAD